MQRNNDPELCEGLSAASSGEELRERLPTDEDDPEIADAWILDRIRSYSRNTKVSTNAGLMSTRACHTFPSFCLKVEVVLDLWNLWTPLDDRIHLICSHSIM